MQGYVQVKGVKFKEWRFRQLCLRFQLLIKFRKIVIWFILKICWCSKLNKLIVKQQSWTNSYRVSNFFNENRKYTSITVLKIWLQTFNIRNHSEPLKQTGRCAAFLVFDRRGAVTFGSWIRGVENKILCNLLNRVPKVTIDEKWTLQQARRLRDN